MGIHTCGHLRSVRRAFLLAAFFGVTALALATSLASGVKANFGTMAKSLHCVNCCK